MAQAVAKFVWEPDEATLARANVVRLVRKARDHEEARERRHAIRSHLVRAEEPVDEAKTSPRLKSGPILLASQPQREARSSS